jgi:single-stranded-DNA-specific exonuclease
VDLHRALHRCAGHLRRFGGHAAAAGLELDRQSLPAFEEAFEAAVREQAPDEAPDALSLDAEADPSELTAEVVTHVGRLAPFGEDNPEPRLAIRGATVAGRARLVGPGSEHLSFALRTRAGAVRVVAFRRAEWLPVAAGGGPIDLVVTPVMSEWRGARTPELVAHAIRASEPG